MAHSINTNSSNFTCILAMLFIISPVFLQGEVITDDCCPKRCELEIEYLYFKPAIDSNYIAAPNLDSGIPFTLRPGGPGKRNTFDYTSGVRVTGSYFDQDPCGFIEKGSIGLTYLPAHHKNTVSLASFLSSLTEVDIDIPGFLTSKHQINYYAVDALVTIPVLNVCRWSCSLQPGLHYAYAVYQNHAQFSSTDVAGSVKEKSHSWGLGPQLGFDINYQWVEQVALHVGLRGGLLFSRARTQFSMTIEDEGVDIAIETPHPKTLNKVFPFWETRVGLAGSFFFCDCICNLEVGYEYLTYCNFIDRAHFPGADSLDQPDNSFSNFDMQGPYISLLIAF